MCSSGVKPGNHLLVGVNVVSKIAQAVAELFNIELQDADLAGDIDELRQIPLVKALDRTVGRPFGLAVARLKRAGSFCAAPNNTASRTLPHRKMTERYAPACRAFRASSRRSWMIDTADCLNGQFLHVGDREFSVEERGVGGFGGSGTGHRFAGQTRATMARHFSRSPASHSPIVEVAIGLVGIE